MNVYLCIVIMSVVTYTIRMLPLLVLRKEITNRFILSFLHYAPYVTLAVMTFPGILYCTDSLATSLVGFACAVTLTLLKLGLVPTIVFSCIAAYIAQLVV